MTDNMTRVTLTNAATTNTATISTSVPSSSHNFTDLTVAKSSSTSSVSSTLPLRSTTAKEKNTQPRKIHTYDDYHIHILKWPVSLIDELGLSNIFIFNLINFSIFIEPEAGILYKEFLGENVYPVPLLELYSSFDEYEEITLPWLFEETFEEVK